MTTPKRTADRLRVLARVLALADERRSVSLMDAADEVGFSARTLRELLEPVLFLEWRDADGELRGESRAFLLTEDEELVVTEEHWLRGLASTQPDPATALRLFVAGVVLQAATTRAPNPALDHALERLASILDADIVVHVDRPRWTDRCEQAYREGRTLQLRYLSLIEGVPRDFEIEPHLIASRWGNWYVLGRIAGDDRVWALRIDRILDATLGERTFERVDMELPEWWDLSEHERSLIVRLPQRDLARLPQPVRVTVTRDLEDARVEAELVTIGPRRHEHLLLSLGADAEIVWPDDARALQRDLAKAVLAQYD